MSQLTGIVTVWDTGDCIQLRWSVTDKQQPENSLYRTKRGAETLAPQQYSDEKLWLQEALIFLVEAL